MLEILATLKAPTFNVCGFVSRIDGIPKWQQFGGHLSYGKSERPSVRRTVRMSELLNIARRAANDLPSHL